MSPTASPRLAWAAEVAAPRPADRVLEVGCGHGVLLGLLADRVTEGLVVGLDRSATMTAAAFGRNRAAVAAGRVRVRTAALLDAALDADLGEDRGKDLGEGPFDLVVAVHVGAFWRPPAHEYDVVRRVLAPDGRLLLVTQPLQTRDAAELFEQVEVLAAPSGLTVQAVHMAETPPRPSIAVELTAGPAPASGAGWSEGAERPDPVGGRPPGDVAVRGERLEGVRAARVHV